MGSLDWGAWPFKKSEKRDGGLLRKLKEPVFGPSTSMKMKRAGLTVHMRTVNHQRETRATSVKNTTFFDTVYLQKAFKKNALRSALAREVAREVSFFRCYYQKLY